LASVRDGLKSYIDHERRPGDLAAIVRTQGGMGILQQFTTDARVLHAAADDLRYYHLGRGVALFNEPMGTTVGDDDGAGARQDREYQHFMNEGYGNATLNALEFVLDGMRE